MNPMNGISPMKGANTINTSMISPINTQINHPMTPMKSTMSPSMNTSISPMIHSITPINHSVNHSRTPSMKPTMNHMMNPTIVRGSPYYGPRPLSNMAPRPRQPLYTERQSVGRQEDFVTTPSAEVNRTNRIALPPIGGSFSLQQTSSFTGSMNSQDMSRGSTVLRTESVANGNSYFKTTKIAQV